MYLKALDSFWYSKLNINITLEFFFDLFAENIHNLANK